MKIIFATNNQHKLEEIRAVANGKLEIFGLQEVGIYEDITENQDTIEGNAIEKARFIYNKYSLSCFADDTGLEVEALNMEPGVYSARYAGNHANEVDNVDKLLHMMQGIKNRNARFKTVIAFIYEDKVKRFVGLIKGEITIIRRGHNGFGYDPVFLPNGHNKTFAEMSPFEKNNISHRSIALQKFVKYLKEFIDL